MDIEFVPYTPPLEIKPAPTARFSAIMLLSAIMAAGIGGTCSISQTADVAANAFVQVVPFGTDDESEADLVSATERLQQVRDILKLNMTDLAQVFGVSRTALYACVRGTLPHPKQLHRINELYALVRYHRVHEISGINLLLRVPLSKGSNLMQVLCANEGVSQALDEIADLASARQTLMERRLANSSRKGKLHGADDITPSFSTFE
jgi:DNA-binding XRE family transcriptional regulator